MKFIAEFVFETANAEDIYLALKLELEDQLNRSSMELIKEEGSIRLKAWGDDPVPLRAALNTWIRLVKIAFEMVSI